jgi:hypothetical protein
MNFDVSLSSITDPSLNFNFSGIATINGDLFAQLEVEWSTNPSLNEIKNVPLGDYPDIEIPILGISFGFTVLLDLDLEFNLTVEAKANVQAGATIQIGYYAVASYNSETDFTFDANAYIMNSTYHDPQIQMLGGNY